MSALQIVPALAAAGFLAYAACLALDIRIGSRHLWLLPATLSAVFFAGSLHTIAEEGVTGFWAEHTDSLWGNQVWVDLLLAAAIALSFLVPAARRLGMNPVPWVIATACTGSIALLAMLARVMYLSARTPARDAEM